MKKLLVVVDMQNDFVDGALGTKEAVAIIPAVCEKIKSYDKKDILVTRDTHQFNYLDTREGKFLPVVHCIENTYGWELRKEIKELVNDCKTFNKPTFGSVELVNYLKSLEEPFSVELIGVCTDICVVSNALLIKSTFPEYDISVDSSCCAGVTPELHNSALMTLKSCQIEVK